MKEEEDETNMRFLLITMFLSGLLFTAGCGGSGGSGGGSDVPPQVFFMLNDGSSGYELGVTDGTAEGSKLVADLYPGPESSFPSLYYEKGYSYLGDTIFFGTSYDGDPLGDSFRGLWKSNGKEEGTTLVSDIFLSADSGGMYEGRQSKDAIIMYPSIHTFQGQIFFAGNDEEKGLELWESDGSSEGTVLVKDINPEGGSYVVSFETLGNKLFFAADDGETGQELWCSDGSSQGTTLVKDIFEGPMPGAPQHLTPFNGELFFTAEGYSEGEVPSGRELWKSNGTESGTVLVKDLIEGPTSGWPHSLCVVDSTLFFASDYTQYYQYYLPESEFLFEPEPKDSMNPAKLWKSDGSSQGTTTVMDFGIGNKLSNLCAYNGEVYFYLYEEDGPPSALWKSDGTTDGTVVVQEFPRALTQRKGMGLESNTRLLASANGLLFFFGVDEFGTAELWRSDGTPEGTSLIKDINGSDDREIAGPGLYKIGKPEDIFGIFSRGVVFGANDSEHGFEPWFSNGSSNGTQMLIDGYEGSEDGWLVDFGPGGDRD